MLRFARAWPVHCQREDAQPHEQQPHEQQHEQHSLPDSPEAQHEALHEVYDLAVATDVADFRLLNRRILRCDAADSSAKQLPNPVVYVSVGFPCRQLLVYNAEGEHLADVTLTLSSSEHIAGVVTHSPSVLSRYHIGRLHACGSALFVSDCQFDCVYVCDLDGRVRTVVGTQGAKPGELDTPMGVHVEQSDVGGGGGGGGGGRLLVCDSGNRRLQLFARPEAHAPATVAMHCRVRGACFLPGGRVCVANFDTCTLHLLDRDCRLVGTLTSEQLVRSDAGENSVSLREPFCVLPGPDPNTLLVSFSGMQGDHSVRLLDLATGRTLAKAGGRGEAEGRFCQPRGMALHADSRQLYVVDAKNRRVQVYQL